jgi:hypothetical protein
VAAAIADIHSPSYQLVAAVPHHGVHGRAGVGLVAARVWEEVTGEERQEEDWGRGTREGTGRG